MARIGSDGRSMICANESWQASESSAGNSCRKEESFICERNDDKLKLLSSSRVNATAAYVSVVESVYLSHTLTHSHTHISQPCSDVCRKTQQLEAKGWPGLQRDGEAQFCFLASPSLKPLPLIPRVPSSCFKSCH